MSNRAVSAFSSNEITYNSALPNSLKQILGDSVIDVFITYPKIQMQGVDWESLKGEAKRSNFLLNIYRIDKQSATATKFIHSIKTSGRTVIVIGHSYTDGLHYEKHMKGGSMRGTGLGIEFHNGGVGVGFPDSPYNVIGTLIRAKLLLVFTCDFGKTFQSIISKTNTPFIYADNGEDGSTSLPTLDKAAFESVKTILKRGTPLQIRDAAQKVFENERQEICDSGAGVLSKCNTGM